MLSQQTIHRAVLVLAGVCVVATGPVLGPAADAAGVQVTHTEYKKVKVGMKPGRVRDIVGAKGQVVDGSTGSPCYVRKYSGWSGKTVYFKFEDPDATGAHLSEKATTGQLPDLPPSCPVPS